MATNHVGKIKQRALDVITQPDEVLFIRDVAPTPQFNYPDIDPDSSADERRAVMDKIESIAAQETAALLRRVMIRP